MAIVRWDPFREFGSMRNQIDRLFDDWQRGGQEREGSTYSWSPNVDIYEDKNEVTLSAELPGLEDKDVNISVEDNTLTLSGEKKISKEKKADNYHRVESFYGSFARSFSLPANVDRDKIKANMDKGVLHVVLPKKEEAKPKQISIEVGKK